jgi:hypothetical protein
LVWFSPCAMHLHICAWNKWLQLEWPPDCLFWFGLVFSVCQAPSYLCLEQMVAVARMTTWSSVMVWFSPYARQLPFCAWSKWWPAVGLTTWSSIAIFSLWATIYLHICLLVFCIVIGTYSWMFDRTVIDHFGTSYKVDAIMPILSLISSQFFILDLVILSHVQLVSCALNFTWSCNLQWLLWFVNVFSFFCYRFWRIWISAVLLTHEYINNTHVLWWLEHDQLV